MRKVTVMDRDWMYKTSRLEPSFLENVRKKFLPFAQKHRLSLGRDRMICLCYDCKNRFAQEDNVVLAHLVRYGFIKDPKYTLWKYHSKSGKYSEPFGISKSWIL